MLSAARVGDWDQLVALESDCARQVSMLRQAEPLPPLSGSAREEKVRILRKILADDREIRNLTEPWMAKLETMMHSTSAERKLSQTYGSMQAG
jgi:flagellar protein FliT